MTLGARVGPKRGSVLRRSDMSWMTLEDEADLHALAAVQCEEADPTHCALCAARALLAVAPEPQTAARTGAQQTQRTHTFEFPGSGAYFERQLDTTDAWIRSRTRIAERRVA